jgi:hypothetical protein
VKCFWCYRLFEERKLTIEEVQDAQVVYGGESMCFGHLDAIRRVGAGNVITNGVMS